MRDFSVEVPINPLSFGQVSVGILREIYKKGLNPPLFIIGDNADLSCFDKMDKGFANWLEDRHKASASEHKKSNPVFKLWHLNDCLKSYSHEQILFTFYELDSPTAREKNAVFNQKEVLVSSSYAKRVFEDLGCKNVSFCPLGFDTESFYVKPKKKASDRIVFGLCGKLEKRKQHHKVLAAWNKKYGNNPRYLLNCALQNRFLPEADQSQFILNVLKGNKPFNMNFVGFMPTNSLYNDFLNSNDIILGASAGEGWGLPEFQSVGLGKHAVILNAHSYKDWANEKNSVLFDPSGKIDCYDNVFFKKGGDFNQGQYFDWDEDSFIAACEEAVKRFENNPVNQAGLDLPNQFTWEKTVDIILESINKVN